MKNIDVVVIGTGFCASSLTNFLGQNSLSIQVIEPSSVQSPIIFTKTVNSVFSEDQANKTSGFGGGSSVWGKAITHPTDKNWFVAQGNVEWESLHERLSNIDFSDQMNIPRTKNSNSNFTKKYFPNLTKRFLEEIGLYAGNELGKKNVFSLPQIESQILMHATVIDLRIDSGNYLVRVRERSGKISEMQCKYLVLACGTFLNACYFSLINGQKDFPLSNHFSADFGRVALKKPIIVNDGVQTYANGEKAFSTFASMRSESNGTSEPNSSIRFQAKSLIIGRKMILSTLLKFNFFHLLSHVIPYKFSSLKSSRLVESLGIRVIADQNICQNNGMRVLFFRDGIFHIEISLMIEERVILDAHRAVTDFIEIVKTSKIVRNVDLINEGMIVWEDPAHYFGTTPIGMHNYASSLTSNSESRLHPGLYIIGNSSFPVGSHGHPTLLAMQLSIIAAMSILKSEKGK
jgi:hypothetical protein